MTDLAIGVIGAGGMGARHALNIQHHIVGARVGALYDLDQARASAVAAQCGAPLVAADPFELIQHAAIDAILIVSPDPTHAAFVHECLRQRKPVLCEKPLATSAADALAIVAAECALGRRMVSVGFMRRFDPQHVAVKQALTSGAIGKPFLFKGVHRNPMIPAGFTAPMVVMSSASHDIDSLRWLLEQEISEVYVRGIRTHATLPDVARDLQLYQITLHDGRLATIEVAVAVEYGYEVLAEIIGERGAVATATPVGAYVRSQSAAAFHIPASHLDRFQPAYIAEMHDWVQSIRAERPFNGASAWDGAMAALAADACIESLRSGVPVAVAPPERPELYA